MAGRVTCPSCSAANDADQRFCSRCGTPLGERCGVCGTANAPGARFCGSCGAPLAEQRTASGLPRDLRGEERKIVSVLFADLVGSTAMADGADPEDVQARLRPYFARARTEIEALGGTVEKFIGDAVVGLFGAPRAHEDDPFRAVQAALRLARAIEELNREDPSLALAVRVAVETGEAVVSVDARAELGEAIGTGDVMNTASRLQQFAPVGGVVVGPTTFRSTAGLFDYEPMAPVTVRGKTEPIPIWVATAQTQQPERPPIAPLVGRARELDVLAALWDRVRTDRRPQMVTIIGPPGIGKSRLVREFEPRLAAEGRYLKGRCRPYGDTTGYGAFGQQVLQLAEIYETDPTAVARDKLHAAVASLLPREDAERVEAHLAILLGLSDEGAPDRQLLFHSVRRFVEALADRGPTAFVFEDVHWAEPALLDLVESLAGRLREAPVLLVTLARPELLDARPAWGGGLIRYAAIPLDALPDADARRLASSLVSAGDGGADLADRLVHASGGNPLFLEELAASLAERASIASGVPTSVQAIITARLDALPPFERQILQDASAIGQTFWRGPLAAILGYEEGLDDALDVLQARDFIRRQPVASVPGDQEFIFKHVLTREVAYGTLPRAARRERHRIIAEFIERASGDRVRESASILAHHFGEAGDPRRAATYLVMAADVASRAWAKQQAVLLYSRAIELIEELGDHDALVEARMSRAWTLIDATRFTEALEGDIEWLLRGAAGRDLAFAHLARAKVAFWMADAQHVGENSAAAAELAAALGDAELEGRALAARSEAEAMRGDLPSAFATWERALRTWTPSLRDASFSRFMASRAIMSYWSGDFEDALALATEAYRLGVEASNLEAAVTGACNQGLALVGLSRHEEGLEWFDRGIVLGREWEEQTFRFTSRALNMRAGALRELGDVRGARAQSEEALELAQSSGFPPANVAARLDLLSVDLLEGAVGSAERGIAQLVEAVEGVKGFHLWLWSIRLKAIRAETELLGGRIEEAIVFAREALAEAERIGRRKYACLAGTSLGRALLQRGDVPGAIRSLEAAVTRADDIGHAPSAWAARRWLADARIRAGDDDGADEASSAARSTIETFAARLSEEHRRTLLSHPDAAAAMAEP